MGNNYSGPALAVRRWWLRREITAIKPLEQEATEKDPTREDGVVNFTRDYFKAAMVEYKWDEQWEEKWHEKSVATAPGGARDSPEERTSRGSSRSIQPNDPRIMRGVGNLYALRDEMRKVYNEVPIGGVSTRTAFEKWFERTDETLRAFAKCENIKEGDVIMITRRWEEAISLLR